MFVIIVTALLDAVHQSVCARYDFIELAAIHATCKAFAVDCLMEDGSTLWNEGRVSL